MIYIASPYTHEKKEVMQERYEETAKFCAECIKEDFIVFSSVVHWHAIAGKYNLPVDAKFWAKLNIELLRGCDTLWVLKLKGWEDSIGVNSEIFAALALNLDIHYMNPVKED
uniref:DUF1937 domain-containing protein n=1 Tax=viral metagenome TaxID=1070528 RepID=A0A6H1ZCW8_9ZZZZ